MLTNVTRVPLAGLNKRKLLYVPFPTLHANNKYLVFIVRHDSLVHL
jgi:hypothetical protein